MIIPGSPDLVTVIHPETLLTARVPRSTLPWHYASGWTMLGASNAPQPPEPPPPPPEPAPLSREQAAAAGKAAAAAKAAAPAQEGK